MIHRHLVFAFRSLFRHKSFSVISVGGLFVGLTAFLLMGLYVENELSFDRFHAKADRIFRVTDDKTTNALKQHSAASPAPLAPVLLKDFPVIEAAVRLIGTEALVGYNEKLSEERRIYFADPSVFNVFSLGLQSGDSSKALAEPASVVINQSTSEKYFGHAGNAIGKILLLDKKPMKVTAVVRDMPGNSHWQFDMLISMSTAEAKGSGYDWLFSNWYSNDFYTYILLKNQSDAPALATQLAGFSANSRANTATVRHQFSTEKLTDIYLRSDRDNQLGKKGSLSGIRIFSAVATFILLLACINFVNLATARASERAKEVAIKKVNGVSRGELVKQFFIESFLMTGIALSLALMCCYMLLPWFNAFSGKAISFDLFSVVHLASIVALLISVGFLSGLYPAIILSGFDPITALKGRILATAGELALRKGLVVFQFSISIVLITGSIVVYRQLHYMQDHDLGFNRAQTLVINFEGDQGVKNKSGLIREQLLRLPGVSAVTASSNVPGDYNGDGGWSMDFVRKTGDTIHSEMPIYLADFHFLDQYHVPVMAGRGLSPVFAADTVESMMINETALHRLGFRDASEAIGVKVGMYPNDGRVVGVFRDFHFESLQKAIEPLAIRIIPGNFRLFSLQIRSDNVKQTLAELEKFWKTAVPQRPLEYSFLDETFNRQYAAQQKFGQLFSIFTALAIGIACFGLFGLVMYSVRLRTKEIGIRKVVGASIPQIVLLLSQDFFRLIALAVLIAIPIALLLMRHWISSFAYRIDLNAWMFFGAGGVALLVGMFTISYQSIKAAIVNPIRSLRSE